MSNVERMLLWIALGIAALLHGGGQDLAAIAVAGGAVSSAIMRVVTGDE